MWLKCSLCSKNCFFSLLLAIFFELPITRTFFDFPWRFELSGVNCINLSDMHITKVFVLYEGSKGRAVVTALIPYQYGLGLNPGVETICGLNFLLVLSLAARGFSSSSPVFPFLETLPISNSIWNTRTSFNEFLRSPKCSMAKQITKLQKKNYEINSLCRVVKSSWLPTKIATFVLG